MGEIVKNLSKMAVPDPKQRLKMTMLSGVSGFIIGPKYSNGRFWTVFFLFKLTCLLFCSQHDTTVIALQASLDVYSGRQPPYAACYIFELYRDDNG